MASGGNGREYAAFKRAPLVAIVATALAFASCAGHPPLSRATPPETLLPQGAVAYLKLDGFILGALLESFLPPGNEAFVKDASTRTQSVVMALAEIPRRMQEGGGPVALPPVVAIASGKYPAGAAGIKLGMDKAWVREGPNWKQRDGGLRVGFAGTSTMLLATIPLEQGVADTRKPGAHPIPDEWLASWSAPVALFLPDPLAALSELVPLDRDAMPLTGVMLSARPETEGSVPVYGATLSFGFADERSALVYAPVCRIFLYGLARGLWPDKARGLLANTAWERSGNVFMAAGLKLSAQDIASFASLRMP